MDEHSFNQFGTARKIPFQIPFQEKANRPSSLEERLGIDNWNAEIRAAETSHNGKCYPDDFPIAIDQVPAGPAGSGLRIVNNFVGKDVADMALRNQRPNEFAAHQLIHNFCRVTAGGFDD